MRTENWKLKNAMNPYFQAAERIAAKVSHCCCYAIQEVVKPQWRHCDFDEPHIAAFRKLFEPPPQMCDSSTTAYWWSEDRDHKPSRNERILALLFMAHMTPAKRTRASALRSEPTRRKPTRG